MLYEIARPVLFSLDAETAHETALASLNIAGRLLPPGKPLPAKAVEVMGLRFPNRIGLAAGLAIYPQRIGENLPILWLAVGISLASLATLLLNPKWSFRPED